LAVFWFWRARRAAEATENPGRRHTDPDTALIAVVALIKRDIKRVMIWKVKKHGLYIGPVAQVWRLKSGVDVKQMTVFEYFCKEEAGSPRY
jgi:hypothetical protein